MKCPGDALHEELWTVMEGSEAGFVRLSPGCLDEDGALLRVLLDMVQSLKQEDLRRHLVRELREALEAKGRNSGEKSFRTCEKRVQRGSRKTNPECPAVR
jgi:hypothetical protein